MNKKFYNIPSFVTAAFGKNVELLPSVDELYRNNNKHNYENRQTTDKE